MDERTVCVLGDRLRRTLLAAGFSVHKTTPRQYGDNSCWWLSIASWAAGRPTVWLWADRNRERDLGIWVGFIGVASAVKDILEKWPSKKRRTIPYNSNYKPSDLQQIKHTRGTETLIHESEDPRLFNFQYAGFYDHVSRYQSAGEIIDRAAALIIDIRSKVEPDSIEYDRIIGVMPKTERNQLIRARVGHAKFCNNVRKKWHRCAVTGCSVPEALRASHIVSWASSKKDRLDSNNGLLLVATIDALFDRGLISFKDDGSIVICTQRLNESDQKTLGLSTTMRIDKLNDGNRNFLRRHRKFHRFEK